MKVHLHHPVLDFASSRRRHSYRSWTQSWMRMLSRSGIVIHHQQNNTMSRNEFFSKKRMSVQKTRRIFTCNTPFLLYNKLTVELALFPPKTKCKLSLHVHFVDKRRIDHVRFNPGAARKKAFQEFGIIHNKARESGSKTHVTWHVSFLRGRGRDAAQCRSITFHFSQSHSSGLFLPLITKRSSMP